MISTSSLNLDSGNQKIVLQELSQNSNSEEAINAAYKTFNFQASDLTSVEDYLKEYFSTMLKKLRDLNYDQTQAARRKDLTF